ncbi:hypothetical protein INS49_007310 [Diaporthe citri]|uniref:uncharacterized protein n=1 Tax=Diaporthe citri TaxID=83186 RepID=UPI001C7E858C|nr:uncharacterized protein INS49_007310 [Diaporthe citri]KAG6365699.1 hypothetical protein INS49_007310 [Diaporthe citri]
MPYTYTISSALVSAVQGSSSDHASTTTQQGSTGRRTPPQGHSQRQPPRRAEYRDEKREDRMKHDLLGFGSQFETKQ